jgi:hypothetical protein
MRSSRGSRGDALWCLHDDGSGGGDGIEAQRFSSSSRSLRRPAPSRMSQQRDESLRDQLLIIGPAAARPPAAFASLNRVSNPMMRARASRFSDAVSDRLSAGVVVVGASTERHDQYPWLYAGASVSFTPPGADLSGNRFESSCPGELLCAPDGDGEAQVRWAGGELSGWLPIEHLQPASPGETRLVEVLRNCEPIAWIQTETFSMPPKKILYVTWRDRHSRRVLCMTNGTRVSAAFLMMNDFDIREGILPPGDGRCATLILETDAEDPLSQPAAQDMTARVRWPCGMQESTGVSLARFTRQTAAHKAESDAWEAYAADAKLRLAYKYSRAHSVLSPVEWHELYSGSLVFVATIGNWAATIVLRHECTASSAEQEACSPFIFLLSIGLHATVGLVFAIVLAVTRVKGMHINPIVSYLFTVLVGMLGAAPMAFIYTAAKLSQDSHADGPSAAQPTTQATAMWLRGLSLAANIPHMCLQLVVWLWFPDMAGPVNTFAIVAVVLSLALDKTYGLAPYLSSATTRPHRRLLIVSSVDQTDGQSRCSGGACDQYVEVYWNQAKVAKKISPHPPMQPSGDASSMPTDVPVQRQLSPSTQWNSVVQVWP